MADPGTPAPPTGLPPRGGGFELRLEQGRTFVCLGERPVAAGLRLVELAMEVPEARFPFDPSRGAGQFRLQLCDLARVELVAEGGLLASVLPRLDLGRAGVESLRIAFRPGFAEGQGTLAGGAPFTFKASVEPSGDQGVAIAIYEPRTYAPAPVPAAALPALLAAAAGALARPASGGTLLVDALAPVLLRLLPARGWKVPRTAGAPLALARVGASEVRLRWDRAHAGPAEGTLDPERLSAMEGARAFSGPESLLDQGAHAAARDAWLSLGEAARAHPFGASRLLSLLSADERYHDEALDLAGQWLARRPDFAPALAAEGLLRAQRGERARAARAFAELASASARRGEIFAAALAAEACFAAAGEEAPGSVARAAEVALQADPGHVPSLRALWAIAERSTDREGVLRACRRLSAVAPDDAERARAHARLAALLMAPDPPAARLHLDQALRLAPDDTEALAALARACEESGDPLRAARAHDRLREVHARAGDAVAAAREALAVGVLWEERLGHPENALLRYREVAERVPGSPEAREARLRAARLAGSLGHRGEASDHWHALLERLDPADPEARALSARAHRALADLAEGYLSDPVGAAGHLEAAISDDPDDTASLRRVAGLYRTLERPAELLDALDRLAPAADPGERAALLCEAGVLCLGPLSLPDLARERFAGALAADPASRLALEGLARATALLGDGAGEADALSRLADTAPDAERPAMLERASAALERAGELGGALAAAERARALAPRPERLAASVRLARLAGDGAALAGLLGEVALASRSAGDPFGSAEAFLERATLLGAARAEEALAALAEARALVPGESRILAAEADLAEAAGQPDRALGAVRALLASPGAPAADLELRAARLARAVGDVPGAHAHALRARQAGAEGADALRVEIVEASGDPALQAALREEQGRLAEAAELWDRSGDPARALAARRRGGLLAPEPPTAPVEAPSPAPGEAAPEAAAPPPAAPEPPVADAPEPTVPAPPEPPEAVAAEPASLAEPGCVPVAEEAPRAEVPAAEPPIPLPGPEATAPAEPPGAPPAPSDAAAPGEAAAPAPAAPSDAPAPGEPGAESPADRALRLALAGEGAIAGGRPVEGEAMLREALAIGLPRDEGRDAWAALVRLASEHSDQPAEREALAGLVPLAPTGERPALLLRLAALHLSAGDLAAARRDAEEARILAPRDLGTVEACLGIARRVSDDAAVAELQLAAAGLDPASAGDRLLERARLLAGPLRRPEEADRAYVEALPRLPADRALADEHTRVRRESAPAAGRRSWSEPLETFARRVGQGPDAARALRDAAQVALAQGDRGSALRAARAAHARSDKPALAGPLLARLLHVGGAVAEAVPTHLALVESGLQDLDDEEAAALLAGLAELGEEVGDPGLALLALDRLLELRPHDADAAEWRFRLDPDRTRAAARLAEDAERIRSARRRARALALAASAAGLAGHATQARDLLARAREACAGSPALRSDLEELRLVLARRVRQPAGPEAAPELLEALRDAAISRASTGDEAGARSLLEEAVELALRHGRVGDATAGLRSLEERAAARGDLAAAGELARRAARMLAERGRLDEAERPLRRALSRDPSDASAWEALESLALTRGEAGLPLLAEVLGARAERAEGRERAGALVELARLLAGPLEQPDRAVTALQAALAVSPGDPAAEMEMERLLSSSGRGPALARMLLDRALRAEAAEGASLRVRAAGLLLESGEEADRALAVAALRAALAEPAAGRELALRAAGALASLGLAGEAAARLVELCRADPTDAAAAAALAAALSAHPRERLEAFLAVAEVPSDAPLRAEYLAAAARAAGDAGDEARAADLLGQAFDAWPAGDEAFRAALAVASGAVDRMDDVLRRRAAAVPPDAAGCHRARADLLLAAGAPARAAAAYAECLETAPSDPMALAGLAEAHAAVGDGPAALAAARRWADQALAGGTPEERRLALETGSALAARFGDAGEDAAAILERLAAAQLGDGGASDPGPLVERAVGALLRVGENARAASLLALAARATSGSRRADLLWRLGQAAEDRGDAAAARAARLESLTAEPDAARRSERLTEIRKKGDPISYSRALEHVIGTGEDSAELWLELARARAERGDLEGGAQAFEHVVRIGPSAPGYDEALREVEAHHLRTGNDRAVAADHARRAEAAAEAGVRGREWLAAAQALERAGAPAEEIREALRRACEADPDEAPPWEAAAALEQREGHPIAAARAHLAAALRTEGTRAESAALTAAQIFEDAGEAAEAQRAWTAAAHARPGSWPALRALADAAVRRGDSASAAAHLAAVTPGEVPNHEVNDYLRALARALEAAGRPDDAEPAWRDLFSREPADFDAFQGLAHRARAADQLEEWLGLAGRHEAARSATGDVSRRLALRCERARVYATLGRHEAAAGAWRAALELDPANAEALAGLAALQAGAAEELAGEAAGASERTTDPLPFQPLGEATPTPLEAGLAAAGQAAAAAAEATAAGPPAAEGAAVPGAEPAQGSAGGETAGRAPDAVPAAAAPDVGPAADVPATEPVPAGPDAVQGRAEPPVARPDATPLAAARDAARAAPGDAGRPEELGDAADAAAEPEAASAAWRAALAAGQPADAARRARKLASALERLGRDEQALTTLEAARAAAPGDPALETDLARLLAASARALAEGGQLEPAYARLKLARKLDPAHAEQTLALARLAEKLGQLEEAVALGELFADGVAAADPAAAAARLRELAEVLRDRLGDPERAIVLLEKATALAPQDAGATAALRALRARRRDDATRSLETHVEALRRHPADTERLGALAALCREIAAHEPEERGRSALLERAVVAESLARFLVPGLPSPTPASLATRIPPEIRARVAAPGVEGPVGRLFALLAPYLEPLFPVDLSRFGVGPGDRLGPGAAPALQAIVEGAARALSSRPAALFQARRPGVFVAVENTQPPSLVVGPDALSLPTGALAFLVARALALAGAGWALLGKFSPRDTLILGELASRFAGGEPPRLGLPGQRAGAFLAALERSVPASVRSWVGPLGAPSAEELRSLDPEAFAAALERSAGRVALLHAGDLHGALTALWRAPRPGTLPTDDPAAALERPDLSDLARFALSDIYLELRGMLLAW